LRLYLDSSAVVKLVQREGETEALRRFLRRHGADQLVTNALARVEVVRAVRAGGPSAIAHARRQLNRFDQVMLTTDLLDRAATLAPSGTLRSLHAIHLASAELIGTDLRAVVTYDRRMAEAAVDLGLVTERPV
jgi:predicted nucleic acid-binding protein